MATKKKNDFEILMVSANEKKLEIVLPLVTGKTPHLVIEARKGKAMIDKESVKKNEQVETAAKRMYARMRRDKILD